MTWRLAIFDFDGTLADSAGWLMRELNRVAERFGFRQVSEAEIAMLRGYDNRAIIRYLGVPGWKLPFIARHLRRRIAEDAAAIPLFPGTPGLLHGLAARGVTLAVVTSNAEANVRRILGPDCAGLIGCYACGAAIFGKAPKFRRVLRRLGVPREAAISIGDEVRDIEAAKRAGLASAAVTWGYATAPLLQRHCPTLLFDSMEGLLRGLTDGLPTSRVPPGSPPDRPG